MGSNFGLVYDLPSFELLGGPRDQPVLSSAGATCGSGLYGDHSLSVHDCSRFFDVVL